MTVDALDASKESLDYSRRKGAHTNYICANLGPDRLPIKDGNLLRPIQKERN